MASLDREPDSWDDYGQQLIADIKAERRAWKRLGRLLDGLADHIVEHRMWECGDGFGGCVLESLAERLHERGVQVYEPRYGPPRSRPVSPTKRANILRRDGFACVQCGVDEGQLLVVRIVPPSKGGTDEEENLQTRCKSCGSRRGVK